ncbi:MAG: hypothetical protein ACE5SW_13125 [Nitrososphaeraceae archaeon]
MGAHDTILKDFSVEEIDGKFGILDTVLEKDQKTLTRPFIENGEKEILDDSKIIK